MPIVGRTDQKNSGITAHTPRANTAKTSGQELSCPATTKHSSRLGVIVVHESAEPFVTFDTPHQVFMQSFSRVELRDLSHLKLISTQTENTMFAHILMPTDGTDHSERAIKRGIELAKLCGAKVTGIHVMQDDRLLKARSTLACTAK